MKILQRLVLGILLCSFGSTVYSQVCGPSETKIYAFDNDRNIVKNVKFEFTDLNKDDAYFGYKWNWFKEDAYTIYFSSSKPYGKHLLKISAEDFEPTEQTLAISEAQYQSFNLILQPIGSKKSASFERLSLLRGKVTDENDDAFYGAKIILKGKDGNQFETLTDKNGYYKIDIPKGNYQIEFIGANLFAPINYENFDVSEYFSNLSAVLILKNKSVNLKTEKICMPNKYFSNEFDCVLITKSSNKEDTK